jgi:hypothetical protein
MTFADDPSTMIEQRIPIAVVTAGLTLALAGGCRSTATATPGGDIFRWHTHDSSCPTFLVAPGTCQDTFRMLHVWTTEAVTVVDPWNQMPRAAFDRGEPAGFCQPPNLRQIPTPGVGS